MSFVYLLASKPHGTLYVGSTSDLVRRVWEHKIKAIPGFTAKYGVDRLVWFEVHHSPPPHGAKDGSRSGSGLGRSL
jgi:putative endonuclease